MTADALDEQHVREYARACVRAGLQSAEKTRADVVTAIEADLPQRGTDSEELADAWIAEAREELRVDQQSWPEATDYQRLQTAFEELELVDVVVLQGVDDHWSAKDELQRRGADGARPRGIAWFTQSDVWHAVDEGMLEVNLWHGDTANAAPGDVLLDELLGILEKHGLAAHFDEGRVEVDAHWHRRLGQS